MLAHALAVLGLAIYGFEVYRTVQRFGARRPGMLGSTTRGPKVHIFMAVLMTVVFVILAVSIPAVPLYVAPAGAVINGAYLLLAVRYARRRADERKAKADEGR